MAKEYPKLYPSPAAMAAATAIADDSRPEKNEGCLVVNNGVTEIWAWEPGTSATGDDLAAAGGGRIFRSPPAASPDPATATNQQAISTGIGLVIDAQDGATAALLGKATEAKQDAILAQLKTEFYAFHTAYADDGNLYTKGLRLLDGVVGWLLAGSTNVGSLATTMPVGWGDIANSAVNGVDRIHFTNQARGADYGKGDTLKEINAVENGGIVTYWLNFKEGQPVELLTTPPDAAHIHEITDGVLTGGDAESFDIPIMRDTRMLGLTHSAVGATLTVSVSMMDAQGGSQVLDPITVAAGQTIDQVVPDAGRWSVVRIVYSGAGATGSTAYKQTAVSALEVSQAIIASGVIGATGEAVTGDLSGYIRSMTVYVQPTAGDTVTVDAGPTATGPWVEWSTGQTTNDVAQEVSPQRYFRFRRTAGPSNTSQFYVVG